MPKSLLTIVLIACNALLAVALIWFVTHPVAAPAPKASNTVKAKVIQIVNDDGKVVAQLSADKKGGGQLKLVNAKGKTRATLGASSNGKGAELVLLDAANKPVVRLQSTDTPPALLLGAAAAPEEKPKEPVTPTPPPASSEPLVSTPSMSLSP